MKILITGGAGYIGSVLTPKLLQLDHEVVVYDNFMYQQTPLLEYCINKKLTLINADVRDTQKLLQLQTKADVIIPLACLTGAPLCDKDPDQAKSVNSDVIKLMMDHKSDEQLLIYPCTNSGYGVGEDGLHCDENSPLKPISLYGRLKVDTESYLLDKKECVTFRFATVFGASPRMRLDLLVNDFTYRAVYDNAVVLFEPHFKRNYLHIQDACKAFLHTIENYESMKGRPYNVGLSTANLSKQELCESIKKIIPSFNFLISDIGKDPDKRNYIVSNERIESTGFKTDINLDTGITELVKAYQIIKRTQYSNI